MSEEKRLTKRQSRLIHRMGWLVGLGVAAGLAEASVAQFVRAGWLTWVLATATGACVLAVLVLGRALSRTGPPFSQVRWYWPGGLPDEFRFGQKPWHRVAIVFAALPCIYMALITWAGGVPVAAASFGGLAIVLLAVATLLPRRASNGRPDLD